MGAVTNMRPELWRAVVAEVPFVDCLTTMLDDSLPLTITEWEEWGNPVEDADAYVYMKSYSPVDNVVAGAYPTMYVSGGLNDPRVGFWEPAKWVAKLRATRTNDAAARPQDRDGRRPRRAVRPLRGVEGRGQCPGLHPGRHRRSDSAA